MPTNCMCIDFVAFKFLLHATVVTSSGISFLQDLSGIETAVELKRLTSSILTV